MKPPLNTWISVKDAMPELGQKVIIIEVGYEPLFAIVVEREGKKVFYSEGLYYPYSTHWMLLSKPTTK